jgi:hypothetical protein
MYASGLTSVFSSMNGQYAALNRIQSSENASLRLMGAAPGLARMGALGSAIAFGAGMDAEMNAELGKALHLAYSTKLTEDRARVKDDIKRNFSNPYRLDYQA